VRVRSEASTDASVLTVIHPGEGVEVLNHDPAGWSRVQVGGKTGFVRSDFLKFPINNFATFQTTSGVNIRASASTTADIVRTVAAGTNIEVTEHNPTGWSKVRIGDASGFIRSDFLSRGGSNGIVASATTTSDSAIANLKTTGNVNLRASASTDADIVRTLAAGTSVEVLENQSGWSRVRHSG